MHKIVVGCLFGAILTAAVHLQTAKSEPQSMAKDPGIAAGAADSYGDMPY